MALFGDREHDINIQAFFVAGRMTILFALMLLLLPQRLLSQQIQPLQLFRENCAGKNRDATEPNVPVDTVYNGKLSKLLLHADHNDFFYVLDRNHGKILLAKPFLCRADWASGIGAALSQSSTLCALSTQRRARSAHGICRKFADKFRPFVQSANQLEA
jgi:hypothetical protein